VPSKELDLAWENNIPVTVNQIVIPATLLKKVQSKRPMSNYKKKMISMRSDAVVGSKMKIKN